jgi:hypothetical protein
MATIDQDRQRLGRELEAYAGTQELIAAGYGTDDYNRYPTWFTWYAEKFKAKKIIERTGKKSFAEVRAAFEKLSAELASVDSRIAELRGMKDRVATEKSGVADIETQIRTLPQRAYQRARETVARQLRNTPRATLARTLSPAMASLYKTYTALDAKAGYMHELRGKMGELERQVGAERDRVQGEIAWARRKISKGETRPLAYKSVLWRLGFWEFATRDKVYRGYWTVYRSINDYDDYVHSPGLNDQFLWWYVFTHDDPYYVRYERVYRPSDVEQYGRTHPNYRYQPPPRADVDAAAAAARADLEKRERAAATAEERRILNPNQRVGQGSATRIAS